MKLSEYLTQNTHMNRKAKLKVDIGLDNGEKRVAGDEVSIMLDLGHGRYHAEDNDWACQVTAGEIEFVS